MSVGIESLFTGALCRELPVKQVAALRRCADKQLWRRIEHCVEQAHALDDMSTVQIVGIDDTSLHTWQRRKLAPAARLLGCSASCNAAANQRGLVRTP